jgi:cell fate (sporulation/competence/biofilm development) regulator YlbF (YheA/YmcA/DUF963 family)
MRGQGPTPKFGENFPQMPVASLGSPVYSPRMSIIAEDSAVIAKTRELCAHIASDPVFLNLQECVERFLSDDAARLQYQSVHERGEELHHKQHAGIELGAAEIREFEAAREALFDNQIAREFFTAREQLEKLQKEISKYVGMTLELGRVPTAEELAESGGGGCCGGGGGGGCGCSH